MPTPSIQTLRTDAQQVLNLDSISAVRSVVAATLANANAGTPLNPNLTTQQLWNEFYQIVTQPKSDIESIIANQLMKFLYAPPAPGGAGANGQVIFNDGGVLAGDAGLTYNKATDALTIGGTLTVNGAGPHSFAGQVNTTGSTAGFQMQSRDGSGTNWLLYNPTGDDFRIYNSVGNDVVIVNNIGNVGIGVTPSPWLAAVKSVDIGSQAMGIFSGGITHNAYYDNTDGRWEYKGNGSAVYYNLQGGIHEWYVAAAGVANNPITTFATAAMSLTTAGNLAFASGKGIDFSATPDQPGRTSELLQDYEEGTWTGTLTFSTTPQTSTHAFTGRYTKVGRIVHVEGYLLIGPGGFVKGPASGGLQLTGLPYAAQTLSTQYQDLAASLVDINSGSFCFCTVPAGGTVFAFESMGVVGAVVQRNAAPISAANFAATNASFISLTFNFTYTA